MAVNASMNVTLERYLHLQLNTSDPDPIGFAQVSGFYGPGAWAGWFLTICASWYHLVSDGHGFDPNAWLFLAGINWSSFDLFRHLLRLESLRQANDPTWMKESASIGAALTVTWWGFFHVILQVLACMGNLSEGKDLQRGITMILGSILPAVALIAPAAIIGSWGSHGEVSSSIPALYWDNMLATDNTKRRTSRGYVNLGHDTALFVPALAACWVLAFYCFWIVPICAELIPSHIRDTLEVLVALLFYPLRLFRKYVRGGYLLATILGLYIVFVIILAITHSSAIWYFLPLLAPFIVVAFVLLPFGLAQQLFGLCLVYIFSAYLHLDSSPSQSCFFMPCAPQSIAEFDQAFALFAGIFSFAVVEVAVPYLRELRTERRAKRLFEQETSRRIEMVARTRGPAEQRAGPSPRDAGAAVGAAGAGDGNGDDPAPDATGIDIRPASRVNSGIAVEEGRAGLRKPAWTDPRSGGAGGLSRSGTI